MRPHLTLGPEPDSDGEPSWTLSDDDDPSDEGEDLVQERNDECIDDDGLRKEENIGLGAIEDSEEVQEISLEGLPDITRLQYESLKGPHHGRKVNLPAGFGLGQRVAPPQRCMDTSCQGGLSTNCCQVHEDDGVSVEDRWDLLYLLFSLCFPCALSELMAINTNSYAALKGAGEGRPWKKASAPELMIWIGQIIYMSVVRLRRSNNFWPSNGEWPKHCIMRFRGYQKKVSHIPDTKEDEANL